MASFVDCFWYACGLESDHEWERVLPTGAMQLVVNLRDDSVVVGNSPQSESETTLPGAVLSGACLRPLKLEVASRRATVGVSFVPGGAAPFLDRPAAELRDQTVSLETIWGSIGRHLRERLLESPAPEDKFRVLDAALRDRLTASTASCFVDEAVEIVRAHSGTITVKTLVEGTGYSHRHVVDRFRARVGLSPKRFCRVVRFQSVLSRVQDGTDDWTQLALACGYYDQAHLNRDFRQFAGMTPTEYLGRAPDEQNHVPLPD